MDGISGEMDFSNKIMKLSGLQYSVLKGNFADRPCRPEGVPMTLNLIFAKPIFIEPSQNIQTLLSASLNTVKDFLYT